MKILSSRSHHYVARVTILLMMAALIASMVGCGGGGDGAESYALTVDLTAGGVVTVNNVIIPGKAMFICAPGTVVRLNATPSADYRFVRWIGDVSTIANKTATITTITMNGDYNITSCFQADFMVSAGILHTVGLKSDGTVVAVGLNDTEPVLWLNLTGWLDVGNWTSIIQVCAGILYTIGLKSDGTVAVAYNFTELGWGAGPWDVGNWTNITQVSTGFSYTIGLKSDGRVVAARPPLGFGSDFGECDVDNWTDITQVSAGLVHTVGLKSDGTVIAVGPNATELGLNATPCDVGNWTDIVQVAAGGLHTVGLKSDGTVVAVGWNDFGQCDVGNWTNIIQVATAGGNGASLGLPSWCFTGDTLGLRSDGTVVAVGDNSYGQCNVSGWELN